MLYKHEVNKDEFFLMMQMNINQSINQLFLRSPLAPDWSDRLQENSTNNNKSD